MLGWRRPVYHGWLAAEDWSRQDSRVYWQMLLVGLLNGWVWIRNIWKVFEEFKVVGRQRRTSIRTDIFVDHRIETK